MSYQEEIIRYLSTPENLKLALEIEEHLKDVKATLEQKFWKDLFAILKNRNEENSDLTSSWDWEVIEPNWENYRNNYFGVYLNPKHSEIGQRFFEFYIEIEGKRLYGGIRCIRKEVKRVQGTFLDLLAEIPELKKLQDQLRAKDFKSQNEGSLSWKWFDNQSIGSPENLLSLSRRNDYSDLMATNFWRLFEENRQALERINNKISELEGKVSIVKTN